MKTEIEIEKGIPFPKRASGPLSIYPLDKLEIGESFKIEIEGDVTLGRLAGRLSAAIAYYRKHINSEKKFTTRTIDDYIRCWRIK